MTVDEVVVMGSLSVGGKGCSGGGGGEGNKMNISINAIFSPIMAITSNA